MQKQKLLLMLGLLIVFLIVFQSNVKADIFDGSSGGNSIFGGIRDGINSIFSGIRNAFPGGASIPGVTPSPTPTPTPPGFIGEPTPTALPPDRNSGKNLKLTLEWDTQSLGGEAVYPQTEDPLKCVHLGKYEPGCENQTNSVGLITCPCSDSPGQRASNALALDDQNRLIPTYRDETDVLGATDLAGEIPGPPPPAGGAPPGPPGPPAPIIWVVCVSDQKCQIAGLTHVLTGWCGDTPVILDSGAFGVISSKVPPQTAGPNSFSLPNAVSNKYIRRDGYYFQCVTNCAGQSCVQDNYVEFQTMIYPSNAISMSLNVENSSNQKVDNIMVKVNTLTNSAGGETPLPHNVDVYVKDTTPHFSSSVMSNTYYINGYANGSTNNAGQGWGYMHGDEIDETTQLGWKFNNAINSTVAKVDENGRSIVQFQIGPFGLDAGEKKVLDFQPTESEFTKIPATQATYPVQGVDLVSAAKPCECQSVKIHDALGVGSNGCDSSIAQPNIAQCMLYYGIGVKLRSNAADPNTAENFGVHSGGYTCDQQGITVDGCPPSWCFEGAISTVGPFEMCPDWNGDGQHTAADRIPNPNSKETHETVHWFENESWWTDPANAKYMQPYTTSDSQTSDYVETDEPSLISKIVKAIIPRKVLEFTGIEPTEVSAFGCTHPCKNVSPPGLLGLGGLVPRDYNFVCSPTDTYNTGGGMVESGRCDGSDYSYEGTWISPSDIDLFKTYRDVTGLHGCGYNASSNNSVVGPIQAVAEFGGSSNNDRTSRSVLVASIPVGGRLIDDQSRPYGWPTTGEIEQNWGYTGQAANQGVYRSQSWQDYGEYRYCSTDGISTTPPTQDTTGVNCNENALSPDATMNNVKPVEELIAALTGSTVNNWLADASHWESSENSTVKNIRKCYNDLIGRAINSGNDPALVMATWLEESNASNYDSFPDVSDFGCVGSTHNNFDAQISCMLGLQQNYTSTSTYSSCRNRGTTADIDYGKMTADKYMQLFSGGFTECRNNTHVANAAYYQKLPYVYALVRKDNTDLSKVKQMGNYQSTMISGSDSIKHINLSCTLVNNRWDQVACPQ